MSIALGEASAQRSTRTMLWLLLLVYIFNFLDRQIVNILAEPIRKDLGLSDTQLGLMTGLAFALFYSILGLPIARYADRPTSDRGRLIAGALVLWSAATALCGLAQNFLQLLLARITVGVGEAGCTPAAHSLIADRVPPEKRAGAMAFYSLGIPIGALLGMLLGGFLSDTVGWRYAFLVVGAPGILVAVVVVMLIKDHDRFAKETGPDTGPTASLRASVLGLLRSRSYVLLLAAASACAFLSYGKTVWTLIFFQRTHGLTPGEVGLWYGLPSGLLGIAGTWLGGWLADRYGRHDKAHMMTGPAISLAIAAPVAFLAYFVTDSALSLALILLPAMLNVMYVGPLFAATQGLVSADKRAMASALMLFCQNLIGLGLGPLFFGILSDSLQPHVGIESVRYVLYGAAWLGLIPALLFWILRPRLRAELGGH